MDVIEMLMNQYVFIVKVDNGNIMLFVHINISIFGVKILLKFYFVIEEISGEKSN